MLAALAVSYGLLGCDSGDRRARDDRPRASPLELVQTWARPINQVLLYQDVAVPGYELFWVQGVDERGSSGFAVAVPIDEQNFLEGKIALQRLIATGIRDPLDLARLTMVFLERGGAPLVGPQVEPHRQAGVSPPTVKQGVLSYWYERRARTHLELLRSELVLDDLALSTQSMMLQEHDHPTPERPRPSRPKPENHPPAH